MSWITRIYVIYKKSGVWFLLKESVNYFYNNVLRLYLILPILMSLRTVIRFIIPEKEGKIILFGLGSKYKGNSKYVYEYVLKNDYESFTPIWITNNKIIYKKLKDENKPVAYNLSLKGQYYLIFADVACHDEKNPTFGLPISATIIQMRHELPVKFGKGSARRDVSPVNSNKNDYFLSTSEFLSRSHFRYLSYRGINKTDFEYINLGFPRDDILLNDPCKLDINNEEIICENYEYTILYAPTQRAHDQRNIDNTDIFPYEDFSINKIKSLLDRFDILLLIRLHPSDHKKVFEGSEKYETTHDYVSLNQFLLDLLSLDRVKLASRNEFEETNQLLPYIDCLITDYSTIYHTYLLLDRPIIFFSYDYNRFSEIFGFRYNYLENLPGPKIESYSELEDYLWMLCNDEDPHKSERRQLINKLHEHVDGRSRERVVDFIKKIED